MMYGAREAAREAQGMLTRSVRDILAKNPCADNYAVISKLYSKGHEQAARILARCATKDDELRIVDRLMQIAQKDKPVHSRH